MLTLWLLITTIITPILCSKILFLATVPSPSHGMWNTFLATELAKRGHEITYITPASIKETHPNITLKYFKQPDELTQRKRIVGVRLMERRGDRIYAMADNTIYECEIMFENEPYKGLLVSSDEYDLIIFEYIGHDCLFGLTQKFRSTPIVLVGALPYSPIWTYRNLGAPLYHMTPTLVESVKPPFSLWKRLTSLKHYLTQDTLYFTYMQPEMDRIIRKYFGEGLSIQQMWEKVAVYLVNTPDWMNKIPVPPNIISVGGIHLTESKKLGKQLLDFMDGAEHGVILISFGTNFPVGQTTVATFRTLASAVGKLPQRILWKWDSFGYNITLPENVLGLPWLPQNDILGHPKMRLFVSHCGGQSSLETMYHGVPVLAVPGVLDESENANRIVAGTAGLRLDFEDITKESFLETTKELISNPRYREGALKLKSIMRDQPLKPLDRAIFWIEFVIRHKGAPHLRPLTWDLPHPYSLLIDIALVVFVASLSIVSAAVCLFYTLCSAKKRFPGRLRSKNKND